MRVRSAISLLLALLVVACGDDGGPDLDASLTDGPVCVTDDDCDDDDFCNGVERCQPSSSGADARGCIAASRTACLEGQICDGTARTCTTDCAVNEDADGDGARAIECGGDDCDDSDDARYPGASEVCDPNGRDEDCDPTTFGYRDVDGDGFPDARCCNGAVCGTDCDDQAPSVSPTGAELCNDRDDDCDGHVDEQAGIACWPDLDSDGYAPADTTAERVCGSCGARQTAREPTPGAIDCNDDAASVHPSAPDDQCDELDNDCDDEVDEGATTASQRLFYVDADGDGFGDARDPGMLLCAASVPGRTLQPGDCDDTSATTFPGAPELCNRLADDCAAWPSGATSAPVRAEEDRDQDGAAAIDATCEGGPRPRVDCADEDAARMHCDPVVHEIVAGEVFERVRAGDLDGDGDLDVAAWTSSMVVVFRNDGAGATFTREPVGTAAVTRGAALVDVDGDGDLDILTPSSASSRPGWYTRDAAGTWTWQSFGNAGDGTGTSRVPAADLDGDGLVEVALVNGDDLVIAHRVGGAWQRHAVAMSLGTQISSPMLVDVDGNGTREILVATGARLWVYRARGGITGSWARSDVCNGGDGDFDVLDREPDGDLDVAYTPVNGVSGSLAICTNTGGSSWSAAGVAGWVGGAADVEGGDLDRDGDGDVVVGTTHEVQWLESRASGLQRHALTSTTPSSSRSVVAIGDVDGDGDRDVIVARRVTGGGAGTRLFWLEMVGGPFSAP